MNCGIPFCHTGTLISGMAAGCPIHNLIPEWNDLVYRGLWRQALESLLKTNNFPEFTGRVCLARAKRFLHGGNQRPGCDHQIHRTRHHRKRLRGRLDYPNPPAVRTGKRVAVVGSGPAGLACADQLNKAGHWVTVFERADQIGGLLQYGIPNMKLDKNIVRRRVDLMAAEGIQFVTNIEIGKTYPAEKLLQEFDAVVLACGATKPRDLNIEGRHLKGIHFAVEFLHANTRRLHDQHYGGAQSWGAFVYPYISAEGKGCDCHRRGRHRRRLRRHVSAAGLQERHADWTISAAPARNAPAQQPLARMAEGVHAGLRAGRIRRPAWPRPARIPGDGQTLPG